MGSFRLAAGRRYLHRHFNFTESAVETAPKSLRRSCTSELTRQGTSLRHVKHPTTQPLNSQALNRAGPSEVIVRNWIESICRYYPCMSPCSSDYILIRMSTGSLACSLWGFQRADAHWPFLLIACTQHIFTEHRVLRSDERVVWDTQGFQHIAKFD